MRTGHKGDFKEIKAASQRCTNWYSMAVQAMTSWQAASQCCSCTAIVDGVVTDVCWICLVDLCVFSYTCDMFYSGIYARVCMHVQLHVCARGHQRQIATVAEVALLVTIIIIIISNVQLPLLS